MGRKKREHRSGLNDREYDLLIKALFEHATNDQLRAIQKLLPIVLDEELKK